jgi:hypothetical protein
MLATSIELGEVMRDWFRRLSPGRKFLVGWIAFCLLIGLVFVLTDPNPTEGWYNSISVPFLFSISLPEPAATLSITAIIVIVLIWLWKVLK